MQEKIKVLVVEDSPVIRLLLVHILNADPRIEVVGTAADGQAAVDFVGRLKPDVILMDINMPGMDGFEATRSIMETRPVPIVVCSASMKGGEVENTFRAVEAGALAFVDKPPGPGHPDFDKMVKEIQQSVKLMSEVRVIRRMPRMRRADATQHGIMLADMRGAGGPIRMVVIGASTGGPPVLQTIFSGLSEKFPAPILVVQHIATGFLDGLIAWLHKTSKLPVQLGRHGEHPMPGTVYFAPDGMQMGLTSSGRICLTKAECADDLCPSASHLFKSAAEVCGPKSVVGVLLSGMGDDGADALKMLKDHGAVTIAQDKESSVVFGMPGEAIRIGAVTHVLPPEEIAATLNALAKVK